MPEQRGRDEVLGKDVGSVVFLRELDIHLIPKQDTIDYLQLPLDEVSAVLSFLIGAKILFHQSLALSLSGLNFC